MSDKEKAFAGYLKSGDQQMAEEKFSDAMSSYMSAFNQAAKVYGHLSPKLLPILDKLVEATYQGSNEEYYKKALVGYLRTILTIKQREHGISSPELLPVLEQLVVFYDYDGAHMLAIEVKQRIEELKAENAAA